MKTKFLLLGLCCFSLLPISSSYAKRGYSYSYKTPRYSSSYGNTHTVRPYLKKDGTFVQGHRAGNPGSGMHCKNNICY